MLWGWWPGGCWLLGWLLVAPPVAPGRPWVVYREETARLPQTTWAIKLCAGGLEIFVYFSLLAPPKKKSDSTTTPLFEKWCIFPENLNWTASPTSFSLGKPSSPQIVRRSEMPRAFGSAARFFWDPRMWTPGKSRGGRCQVSGSYVHHRSWKSPRGRGLYPKQCHLKPYNRLLLRAYEAIDCPLIDKWPAALGG